MAKDLSSFVGSDASSRLESIAMQYFELLQQQLTTVLSDLTTQQNTLTASVTALQKSLDIFESSIVLDETFAV